MTIRRKTLISLTSTILLLVVFLAISSLWFLPRIGALRTSIDNDRASAQVINQQQSNLTKLSQDIESIREQQADLDREIWPFLKEDDFFTALDAIAKRNQVQIEPLEIAEATPGTAALSRVVSATILGSTADVLKALQDLQRQRPLIAIQQLTMTGADKAGRVSLLVAAQTIWK